MSDPNIAARPAELSRGANRLRFEVTRMIAWARSCHVGSCLSVMDTLVALYGAVMNRDADPDDRDRMILSKGHVTAALDAVLAEYGYFPAQRLEEYLDDGSPFIAHTNSFRARRSVPGRGQRRTRPRSARTKLATGKPKTGFKLLRAERA